MNYRTARARFPHRPEMWPPEFVYEPLPLPDDHPELDLFEIIGMLTVQSEISNLRLLLHLKSQNSNRRSPRRPWRPRHLFLGIVVFQV
jgi:hypothetical protein